MSSKSKSVSVHVSASESTSNSDSSSTSGSSATSPRETAGTSRDPTSSIPQHSNLPEEVAESDDTPVFQKYTEMMQQKSWLGIASIIKTTPVALKRKYYMPADYAIIIPRSFDRMHQPPEGYCTLSVLHLDAGLCFPLPREVNNILVRLGLCPMQLSPNSISHILLFIIVMKHLDLPSSFDNFWSLYNITASKRSGETGWFYLTTCKDCRFLDDLRYNVGPWRDRYFFIRPPPGQPWDFYLGWRESKPTPETFGERFESDLINYITLFWYLPKVLLQEKVLKLAGLSPTPIPVKSSLGDFINLICFLFLFKRPLTNFFLAESEIMLARIANKTRAKKGTLPPSVDRELKRAAAAAKGKSKERAPTPTPSSTDATASEQPSILVEARDQTPDEQVEVVEISEDPGLKWKRAREAAIPAAETVEPTESKSDPSSKSTRQGRLEAKLAADRVAELESKRRQDSWEVYKAACLERDQVILAQTSLTSLEEHFAHNMTQAMTFAHNISLQCSVWRHDKILLEAKTVEMEKKFLEQQALIESLQSESREKRELASKLEISEKELEEARSTAQTDRAAAFEAGKEHGSAEEPRIPRYVKSSSLKWCSRLFEIEDF
ncbi:UNVERIFIED_CONTAM: hypothetical protein Sindi_0913100 [Sesamum indicum]